MRKYLNTFKRVMWKFWSVKFLISNKSVVSHERCRAICPCEIHTCRFSHTSAHVACISGMMIFLYWCIIILILIWLTCKWIFIQAQFWWQCNRKLRYIYFYLYSPFNIKQICMNIWVSSIQWPLGLSIRGNLVMENKTRH